MVSDVTKYTIKKICEPIMPRATRLSKISKFEWLESTVLLFLRCEENCTGLPENTKIEYFGERSLSLGDIRLHFRAYWKVQRRETVKRSPGKQV